GEPARGGAGTGGEAAGPSPEQGLNPSLGQVLEQIREQVLGHVVEQDLDQGIDLAGRARNGTDGKTTQRRPSHRVGNEHRAGRPWAGRHVGGAADKPSSLGGVHMRRTKIVCTIGPASDGVLEELIAAGMDVARLNFSHGTMEEQGERIRRLRQAAEAAQRNLGILLDIQGPKIRVGNMKPNSVLEAGKPFRLICGDAAIEGDSTRASVSYRHLHRVVRPGNTIYLDDGLIEIKVESVEDETVHCTVVIGGPLTSRKGLMLPDVDIDLPAMTERDKEHIRYGVAQGVDMIAASFVRKAEHVQAVREVIREAGGDQPIIAKIENRQGVEHLEEIIRECDGVMVARGDLGVHIPPEEVPLVQKHMIQMCNRYGKPVITATQMLESMVENPRPTRAEVTDVATAIFDGTDAIMLSGETAMGRYPVQAVRVMDRIARRTERAIDYDELLNKRHSSPEPSISE